MSASYQLNAENGIVRVSGTGEISPQFGTAMIEQSIKFAKENGLKLFLYDLRQMSLTEDLFTLYSRPKLARGLGTPPDSRIAVLCARRDAKMSFLETTANNAGFLHRVFTDESQALEWLKT